MLTKGAVLEAVSQWDPMYGAFIDGRDRRRLAAWFAKSDWPKLGLTATTTEDHEIQPWTDEAFRAQLADDLAFAFEKATNKRAISAELMAWVVLMWLWILESPLHAKHVNFEHYPQYGLPMLKDVALAFGLPNPIGDDAGTEHKYSAEADGD